MICIDFERVLNDWGGGARTGAYGTVEYGFRGAAVIDGFGYRVRLLLVLIAWPSDAVGKFGSGALLDHMRGFVSGKLHVGFTFERDLVARGIRKRAHALIGMLGAAADGSTGAADIVMAERGLNPILMWQRLTGVGYAGMGGGAHVRGRRASAGFALDGTAVEVALLFLVLGLTGRALVLNGALFFVFGFTCGALVLNGRSLLLLLFFFLLAFRAFGLDRRGGIEGELEKGRHAGGGVLG